MGRYDGDDERIEPEPELARTRHLRWALNLVIAVAALAAIGAAVVLR